MSVFHHAFYNPIPVGTMLLKSGRSCSSCRFNCRLKGLAHGNVVTYLSHVSRLLQARTGSILGPCFIQLNCPANIASPRQCPEVAPFDVQLAQSGPNYSRSSAGAHVFTGVRFSGGPTERRNWSNTVINVYNMCVSLLLETYCSSSFHLTSRLCCKICNLLDSITPRS